jgi:enoyl-CoA hydratase/carnithine racemase
MASRISDPEFVPGKHGFPGLVDALAAFPKPLVLAVNGLGLGIGATVIGFGDLVFMSTEARLKCPFTSLGVAPEAASSYLLPLLIGRQNAAWLLMSSEWFSAQQCSDMGMVFRLCSPESLLETAHQHARSLASKPISSLRAVKRTMTAPLQADIAAARERENACFAELMGGPANSEALAAFAEGREPDFTTLPEGW